MDAPTFRQDFPEFKDTIKYTDSQINFWLGIAVARLSACAWGTLYNQGLELLTAHYLSIAAQRAKVASVGGQPGAGVGGPVSAKSVDKVSLSYDVAVATIEGAGQYNLTTYGTQFYDLALMVGAGGLQVNGDVGSIVIPPGGFWSGDPGWPYQ